MTEKITDRPRTLKELANYYKVSQKTFKSWLSCDTLHFIKPEKGYYYSILQIKQIVGHLGECD